MIDTVIFDLDGTLLDTLDDLLITTNYVLNHFGFKKRTYEEVKSFVGNGIKKLVERSLPLEHKDYLDEAYMLFTEYYSIHSMDNIKVYDGIIELLNILKSNNIKTAVVTNKLNANAIQIVSKYFNGLFDFIIGETAGLKKKPEPDMCLKVLETLGSNNYNTIYIGDSEVDYQTAINSKLFCISCTWGFRTKEFLESIGSKNIIDKPIELLNYIN